MKNAKKSRKTSEEILPLEYKHLRRVFDMLDSKKIEKIDAQQILAVYHAIGVTDIKESDVNLMIWEVDDDLDGLVSWQEVLVMYKRAKNDKTGWEPRKLFNLFEFFMFDKSTSGKIRVDDTLELLYDRYGRDQLQQKVLEIFGAAKFTNTEQPSLNFREYEAQCRQRVIDQR